MSGTLRLKGSTSGYSELKAPAVAGDQTFTLPAVGGDLLTTDNPAPYLTLESGVITAPSLRFEGDSDTGLYSPGAGQIGIVSNSNQEILISNGNVGIGTNSPSYPLHVGTNSEGVDGVSVESPSGSGLIRLRPDGTNGNVIRYGGTGPQADNLRFLNVVNSEIMRIDTNGRVGIGTSSAAVKLDVNGKIRASTGILFGTDTAAANTLDDYEEGTYTPSFTLGSWTYTTQNGSYIKTGNKVTVWIRIAWSARPVGQNLICTLPFTSAAASAEYAGTVSDNGSKNFVTAEVGLGCAVNNSSNELDLYTLKDANPRTIAVSSNFATSGTFTASVTYQV